jgi:hypothetical protein
MDFSFGLDGWSFSSALPLAWYGGSLLLHFRGNIASGWGEEGKCVSFLSLLVLPIVIFFNLTTATYLIVRRRAPTGDFGIRNSARLEAVGAKSTECYAGGAVEAAYC